MQGLVIVEMSDRAAGSSSLQQQNKKILWLVEIRVQLQLKWARSETVIYVYIL